MCCILRESNYANLPYLPRTILEASPLTVHLNVALGLFVEMARLSVLDPHLDSLIK